MIKIGITGSVASGKTTASKILSYKKGPLFNADQQVKKIYANKKFQKLLIEKFKIDKKNKIKDILKDRILKNKKNLNKLSKLIHPLIRKEMIEFSRIHSKKKIIFYEIPLLIENKLMKYFDVIIFIKAKKKIRGERFNSRGGNRKLFNILNAKQLADKKKVKFSDHIVVNEKNINILKKNLQGIITKYV